MEKILKVISFLCDLDILELIIVLLFCVILVSLQYLYRLKLVEMGLRKPMKISDGKKFKLDTTQNDDEKKDTSSKKN